MPDAGAAQTNRYGSIAAEIYDIDKPIGSMPDTAFHLAALAGVEGPILEPACGSGRTLVPLLEAGHEAAGFDPSEEMLSRCRDACAARGFSPDLSRQRFEDFHYDRRFGAIVVPAGSFTLIADMDAALATLRRFHDHLAPGGLLVIDITSLAGLADTREDRRRWTAPNGDLLTLEGKRTATDWLRQTTEAALRYERWRDGVLFETQMELFAQRLWGAQEFRLALAPRGFGDIEIVGGYARHRPPRARDGVLTFLARKL
jgi:SAM-dependent methyltransferase